MSNGSEPISREVIRKAIAAGLEASCTTAQAVYDHAKTDFEGQSPVVRVISNGSDRPQITGAGIRSRFSFLVDVWVLLSDNEGTWTEAQAMDALDQIELEIITWLTENQGGELWTSIHYEGGSAVDVSIVAGEPWLVEEINITAEVYG